MKALIISEEEKVYSTLNDILIKADYDTIIYKWLLKALDNIEEIRPDLIVVSSSEYPRHWKTLVQFVKSGIGGDDIDIYLYEPNPISEEDEEKAKILGVTGCFNKFEEFEELVKPHVTIKEESAVPNTGHFMFTHPVSKKFISGKFFDYNGKTLSCTFYNASDLDSIKDGMQVPAFSFFDSKKTRTAQVLLKSIMKINTSNVFVVVEISDIYEEN